VELAISRVAARVKLGGHSIPEETIRRRFERGRKNLVELYLPLADAWQIYNAGTEPANEIAMFDGIDGEVIMDGELWNQIKK
jgi:predicted ABC-type ATPase